MQLLVKIPGEMQAKGGSVVVNATLKAKTALFSNTPLYPPDSVRHEDCGWRGIVELRGGEY